MKPWHDQIVEAGLAKREAQRLLERLQHEGAPKTSIAGARMALDAATDHERHVLMDADRAQRQAQAEASEQAYQASLGEPDLGPSLQALVEEFGTYDRISADAWAQFHKKTEMWKRSMRAGNRYYAPLKR